MSKFPSGEDNVVPFAPRERTAGVEEPTKRRRASQASKTTSNDWLNASSDWMHFRTLKVGQIVSCKICAAEPGGYAVTLTNSGVAGYLPSSARFNVGDEVLATFVSLYKNRVLLSARFSARNRPKEATDWERALTELDSKYVSPVNETSRDAEKDEDE